MKRLKKDKRYQKSRKHPSWNRNPKEKKFLRKIRKLLSFKKSKRLIRVLQNSKKTYLSVFRKKGFYLSGQYFAPARLVQVVSCQLVNAGLHLGGRMCNRFMSSSLLGKRHGLFLIELSGSLLFLRRGLSYVSRSVSFRIPILLILSKKDGREHMSKKFRQLGHYATIGRYIPGTVSNYKCVKTLNELPGVVCIGDTLNCMHAIKECAKVRIPFFGLCDSEMDPRWFCFPVFGNNDSKEGSQLFYNLLSETVMLGDWRLKQRFVSLERKWSHLFKVKGGKVIKGEVA